MLKALKGSVEARIKELNEHLKLVQRYRFECNLPEHIHMRISASGYKTIGVNSDHPEGKAEGGFDIVLEPEK